MNLFSSILDGNKVKKNEDKLTHFFIKILHKISEITPQSLSAIIDEIFPGRFIQNKTGFAFDQQKYSYFGKIHFNSHYPDCGMKWKDSAGYNYLIFENKVGANSFSLRENRIQFASHIECIEDNKNAYLVGISDDNDKCFQRILDDTIFKKFKDDDGKNEHSVLSRVSFLSWNKLLSTITKYDKNIAAFLAKELLNYKNDLLEVKMRSFGDDFSCIIKDSFNYKVIENQGIYTKFEKKMNLFFEDINKNVFDEMDNNNMLGDIIREFKDDSNISFPLRISNKYKFPSKISNIDYTIQYRISSNKNERFLVIMNVRLNNYPFNRIILGELLQRYGEYRGYYDGRDEKRKLEEVFTETSRVEFKKEINHSEHFEWNNELWVEQIRKNLVSNLVDWVVEVEKICEKYKNILNNTVNCFIEEYSPNYSQFTDDGFYHNRKNKYGLMICNANKKVNIFWGMKVNTEKPHYPKIWFFIEADPNYEIKRTIIEEFNLLNDEDKKDFKLVYRSEEWALIERELILDNFEVKEKDIEKLKIWFNECSELVQRLPLK